MLIKCVHFCFAFLCFVLLQDEWHGERKEREMLRFGKQLDSKEPPLGMRFIAGPLATDLAFLLSY